MKTVVCFNAKCCIRNKCFGGIIIKWNKFVFLVLLFFVGAVFSLSKVGSYLYDGIKSKKIYTDIGKVMKDAGIVTENVDNAEKTDEENLEVLTDVFNEMTLMITDYAGYISIADTNIQYPIVRGNDNVFYLSHDIYGQKSAMGSIFMDYRNNVDFTDVNTLIYGHNMHDQSMFNHLLKFKDDQFAERVEPIVIATKTEILRYSVFAAYRSDKDMDHLSVDIQDEQDFNLYISDIKNRSDIKFIGDIIFGDRLLTLSTCESANSNYRYVVHAVLRR